MKALLGLVTLLAWVIPLQATPAQTETKVEQVTPPTDVQPIQEEKREEKSEAVLRPISEGAGRGPQVSPRIPIYKEHANSESFGGRHYTKEEVQQLIRDYSAEYDISADLPLRIANCESGSNQFSKNKGSTASGVFQYLASTWTATDQGKIGLSVFDAEANVKAAVSYIASRGHARPWTASIHCWNK